MSFLNKHIRFFSFVFLFFFFNNAYFKGYSSESNERLIPTDIVGPITVILCLIYLIANNISFSFPKSIKQIIYFFFIILLIISLQRVDILSSLRNFTAILLTYTIAISMSLLLHHIPFIKVLKLFIFIISFVILPFNLFIQSSEMRGFAIFPDRLGGEDTLRFGGGLYTAHNGMVLGFTLLLVIYMIFILKQRKSIYYVLLIVFMIGILLTDCRSVWGGVAICTFLMFYSTIRSKTKKIVFVFISVATLIIGTVALKSKSETVGNTNDDADFRQLIWLSGINGIAKEPILGYGSINYFQTDTFSQIGISDNLNDPHNSFLDLFLQNGLPASLVLIFLYVRIFKQFKKAKSNHSLYVLFVFWIFVPFFWGHIYKGTTGFIQFYFPLTIFGILLHPDLYRNKRPNPSRIQITKNLIN